MMSILSNSNPAIRNTEDLKQAVREYLALDDQIVALRRAMKERNDRKKKCQQAIMEFMKTNELQEMNTNTGKLQYAKSVSKKPLTKEQLMKTLSDYFANDSVKAIECTDYILEHRETFERERIKRVRPRAKKSTTAPNS